MTMKIEQADALRMYDHLLIMDGIYGRRPLNEWEQDRFMALSMNMLHGIGREAP